MIMHASNFVAPKSDSVSPNLIWVEIKFRSNRKYKYFWTTHQPLVESRAYDSPYVVRYVSSFSVFHVEVLTKVRRKDRVELCLLLL
jgi:hypothetical protein